MPSALKWLFNTDHVSLHEHGYSGLKNRLEAAPPGSNVVPGVDPNTSGSTVGRLDQYLNPAAWENADPFTLGDAPRTTTTARAPAKRNIDLSFAKTLRLSGDFDLQFRFELINALNDPNFRGPRARVGRSDFGKITGVIGFPRTFQYMMRLTW